MKQLYTVPIQMEGFSQKDAEQRVNKVIDIAAGHKPTIWDFICMLGVAYLQDKQDRMERDRIINEAARKQKSSKNARKRRKARADKAAKTLKSKQATAVR